MSTVDPRLTKTFVEWADYTLPSLERYGSIEIASSDDDWQNWAAGILSFGGVARLGVPNPYQFSNWRDWATCLNALLNQGS